MPGRPPGFCVGCPERPIFAATKLVDPILFVAGALSVSLTPYVSRLTSTGGFDEFLGFFRRLVVRALVVLVPLGIVVSFGAEPVVRLWRPEFIGAAIALRWLAFGAVAMFFCHVSSACLVGLGRFWVIAVMATLNLGIFLAIAIPLVPSRGAEGVAMATFGMETINALAQVTIVLWILARLRGSKPADAG